MKNTKTEKTELTIEELQTNIKENTKKTKERFCKISTYNRILCLAEIEKELIKEGAKILTNNQKETILFNVYTLDDNEQKKNALKQLKPIKTLAYYLSGGALSLCFVLDGFYYELSYDENPFFPITYRKIGIDANGNYQGARYCYSSEDLNKKSWEKRKELCLSFGYDNFFTICDSETIKECALYHLEQIKKEIIKGAESASYCDHYHPKGKKYNCYFDERPAFKDYFLREKTSAEIAHFKG